MSEKILRQDTNRRMSKIVSYGGLVYLCGQTANGGDNAFADVTAQTMEVLSRVDALRAKAGTDKSRILATTIYLRDIADFAAMNAAWEGWLTPGTASARTTVEANLASPNLLVEITVMAAGGTSERSDTISIL